MVQTQSRSAVIRRPFLGYSNPKRKKRSGAQILRDILYIAGEGEKKTHILFGSNINPTILEKYLKLSLDHGLLVRTDRGYATTVKGREFIRNYDLFQSLLRNLDDVEAEIKKLLS
jgi:predicted transcriptional regulator